MLIVGGCILDELARHNDGILLGFIRQWTTKHVSARTAMIAQHSFFQFLAPDLQHYTLQCVQGDTALAREVLLVAWSNIFSGATKYSPKMGLVTDWAKNIALTAAQSAMRKRKTVQVSPVTTAFPQEPPIDFVPLVTFDQIRRNRDLQNNTGALVELKRWWQNPANRKKNSRWLFVFVLLCGVLFTLQTQQWFNQPEETLAYHSGDTGVQLSVLELFIKKNVTKDEISAVLSSANARILNGPDRQGFMEIEVARSSMHSLLDTLKASPLVDSAKIQDLRSRDGR
jgi:hypothetical protein